MGNVKCKAEYSERTHTTCKHTEKGYNLCRTVLPVEEITKMREASVSGSINRVGCSLLKLFKYG